MKNKIGIAEIALRVLDLKAMTKFYSEVVGFELLRKGKVFTFFKISDGKFGHPQALALFDRSQSKEYYPPSSRSSTVDHLAFEIHINDFKTESRRLEELGVKLTFAEHAWMQARSMYFFDPEGNHLEFVAHDETIELDNTWMD